MSCEYCSDGFAAIGATAYLFGELEMYMTDIDGWEIVARFREDDYHAGDVRAQINFCPMCGRKL